MNPPNLDDYLTFQYKEDIFFQNSSQAFDLLITPTLTEESSNKLKELLDYFGKVRSVTARQNEIVSTAAHNVMSLIKFRLYLFYITEDTNISLELDIEGWKEKSENILRILKEMHIYQAQDKRALFQYPEVFDNKALRMFIYNVARNYDSLFQHDHTLN
jgi:hypothetical protein